MWFFLKGDHGAKKPKTTLLAAAGFGLVSVVAAIWAELFLPSPNNPKIALLTLFLVSMAVGIIEETAKFAPLALFIHGKSYFKEHTDGVIYFAIVGLTFGFVENLFYVFFYKNSLGGSQFTGIFRLVVLFFFHAASTGIVGYYFAKAKIRHQGYVRPVIALFCLAFVHGMYDFLFFYAAHNYQNSASVSATATVLTTLALVGGLIISALLNTFLFLYYGRARQWDASIGLATDPKLHLPPTPLGPSPLPPYPSQQLTSPGPTGTDMAVAPVLPSSPTDYSP